MARNNNVTLHVGGSEFSTPTDSLMPLLLDLQRKQAGSINEATRAPAPVQQMGMQDETTAQQQQILQLQSQLWLLQQLSQRSGVNQVVPGLAAMQNLAPQQHMQQQQQQLQLQQLFLQQLQQRPQVSAATQLLSSIQPTQLQAAMQQQLQIQQLLQLQQQRQQQQQQLQQQQILQRQLLQQQLAQQKRLQLQVQQQQQQQQQFQLQLQEQARRQQQDQFQMAKPPTGIDTAQLNFLLGKGLPQQTPQPQPPAPAPSFMTALQALQQRLSKSEPPKPPVQVGSSQAPPPTPANVQQKLQLLQQLQQVAPQAHHVVSTLPTPPPPSEVSGAAQDVAKTSLLLSMLSGPKEGAATKMSTSAERTLSMKDQTREADEGTWKSKDNLIQPKGQGSIAHGSGEDTKGANNSKTDLLCSMLGLSAGSHRRASSSAELTPQVTSSPFVSMTTEASLNPAAPVSSTQSMAFNTAAGNVTTASPSSNSLPNMLLAMMAQGSATVPSSTYPTSALPITTSLSSSPPLPTLAGMEQLGATNIMQSKLEAGISGHNEVSPAIQSLQLQQVLAQAGGGPVRFSHVSKSSDASQTPTAPPEKTESAPTLARMQAGEQGITDLQWLVNLVGTQEKASPPEVSGLGTWLHTEGQEPTPLSSSSPPALKSDDQIMKFSAGNKKVYSHQFLKELQFCGAAEATPDWIPQELIRDPNDHRSKRSDSPPRARSYDEHDHRERDDELDHDGGGNRGSRRQRPRDDRRWR